jgi:hypothetical protein
MTIVEAIKALRQHGCPCPVQLFFGVAGAMHEDPREQVPAEDVLDACMGALRVADREAERLPVELLVQLAERLWRESREVEWAPPAEADSD